MENFIKYLNKDGVVIMHDCNPPHSAAAYPANSMTDAESLKLPGWTGEMVRGCVEDSCLSKVNASGLKHFYC